MAHRDGITQPCDLSLTELDLPTIEGEDFVVTGLSSDSREVTRGGLFAALPGVNFHGARFAKEAARRGAAVILTDDEGAQLIAKSDAAVSLPTLVVKNPRAVLSLAASRWFGESPKTIVAVTGTNGKTSVVSFCQQLWQADHHLAASFGTLGVHGAITARLSHTTPDPLTLHNHLSKAKMEGITHVAIEASSHGLAQFRLDGVNLSAAAFTNLTHDHLDYHKDIDAYFDAKAGLFSRVLAPGGVAVICTLTTGGQKIVKIAKEHRHNVMTIGRKPSDDLTLLGQQLTRDGQIIRFSWQGKVYENELSLMGNFQALNVLIAAGLVIATGEESESVFSSLSKLEPIRGRLQLAAKRQNGASVFVDYAHTPEALRASLSSLREHFVGKLVVIFGAGGERDKLKRPMMGKVACEFADSVIVTDDNPRSEEPGDIRSDVMDGCTEAIEIADRAEAIVRGADMLGPGDVLLVAGKGHESGQEIAGTILPFDDFEQSSLAVKALDGFAI